MNQPRYNVSFYIIVPFIFAGLAILSGVVVFRVTEYFINRGLKPDEPVFWTTAAMAIIAYVCGLLIVGAVLKPVEKFMSQAKKLTGLPETGKEKHSAGKIEDLTHIFEQVTNVLTMMDARLHFPNIIAESKPMRGVMGQIMKVAPTDSPVLILGESGTGKKLVARGIHQNSLYKEQSFVVVNCTAISEDLWESELFGYETENTVHPGKFEMADKGTIFFYEIGDVPLNIQIRLLRVLQEKVIERAGNPYPVDVNIRFIAATTKNLMEMVKQGSFKEELYHRLNVFSLRIPSLRERKEDIPILVNHFLQHDPRPVEMSPVALQLLMSYSWHGNVRELRNTVEHAMAICENGMIEPHHLPENIRKELTEQVIAPLKESLPLDEKMAEIEKNLIIQALRTAGGFQVRAAEILGINPRQLSHRIKKYKLDAKTFKD